MIIEWLGFGHSFIVLKPIRGFSIFMTIVRHNFIYGFTIGGLGLDAVYQYYQLKLKEDGISRTKMSHPWKPIQKKFNFLEFST